MRTRLNAGTTERAAGSAERAAGSARSVERLHVDWTACDGRGLCHELLPELLDRDEWGYPVPVDGEREPVVPPALRRYAQEAVARCPRLALKLRPAG